MRELRKSEGKIPKKEWKKGINITWSQPALEIFLEVLEMHKRAREMRSRCTKGTQKEN